MTQRREETPRACEELREALSLAPGESGELAPELAAHVASCADCAALERGLRRSLDAVRGLQRLAAPAELDGRVVAALNAGFREDRAVAHVAALTRIGAPSELEDQLREAERVDTDLSARVALELERPELGIGRRIARVARRHAAPAELEARVAADLERALSARPRLVASRRVLWLPVAAAAAALVLWLGGGEGTGGDQRPGDPGAAPRTASFTIREVSSVRELNSMARALIGGVTGGASEVQEL